MGGRYSGGGGGTWTQYQGGQLFGFGARSASARRVGAAWTWGQVIQVSTVHLEAGRGHGTDAGPKRYRRAQRAYTFLRVWSLAMDSFLSLFALIATSRPVSVTLLSYHPQPT